MKDPLNRRYGADPRAGTDVLEKRKKLLPLQGIELRIVQPVA